jgi:hypothetical protein
MHEVHMNDENKTALLSKLRAEGVQAGDEREAFEAAWSQLHSPIPMNTRRHDDGRYAIPSIEANWRLWQTARAALASAPVALSDMERRAIDGLIAVARAAFNLADGAEDNGDHIKAYRADAEALGAALDALEELPDDQPGYAMGPSNKAEWALRRMLADERECGNSDCEWRGKTERMCGSVGPLCPECGEVTEASAPVAGEAQQPVALVEISVPHLRSISVKIIPDAPMPNVGDLLYAAPQASAVAGEAITDDMRDAVRFAPSSAYWSRRLVEFFGKDAREGINALEKQLRVALESAAAAGEATVYLEAGHLREVLAGNDMPVSASAEPGRGMVPMHAAPQASEAVPQSVIDALKGWTGAEPSQAMLVRAVDAWLDPGAVWESEQTQAAKDGGDCAKGAGDVDDLIGALGQCRDAFPIPHIVGSSLDLLWQEAMSDPTAVPAYVKACAALSPTQPTEQGERDA